MAKILDDTQRAAILADERHRREPSSLQGVVGGFKPVPVKEQIASAAGTQQMTIEGEAAGGSDSEEHPDCEPTNIAAALEVAADETWEVLRMKNHENLKSPRAKSTTRRPRITC